MTVALELFQMASLGKYDRSSNDISFRRHSLVYSISNLIKDVLEW